jgi:hypothetical protein
MGGGWGRGSGGGGVKERCLIEPNPTGVNVTLFYRQIFDIPIERHSILMYGAYMEQSGNITLSKNIEKMFYFPNKFFLPL